MCREEKRHAMIDDYVQAMELMQKMKAHLPIPARPTGAFIQAMRENEVKVSARQYLQIDSVLYLGDEGGIGCSIQLPDKADLATIVSLTHLRVRAGHPLSQEIRAYQRERVQTLAQANRGRKPTQFTLRPRKK